MVHRMLSWRLGRNEGWTEWVNKAAAAAKRGPERRIRGTFIAIGKASMECSGSLPPSSVHACFRECYHCYCIEYTYRR